MSRYISASLKMTAVPITGGERLSPGIPAELFAGKTPRLPAGYRRVYDVTVVTNWLAGLKQ